MKRLVILALLVVAAAAALYLFTQRGATPSEHREHTSLPLLGDLVASVKERIDVRVAGLRNGSRVPVEYTCDGGAREPLITWSSVEGAKSYLVLVLDPDAPGGVFVHLVAYDGVETRWPSSGFKLGLNSAGKAGWYPVCPPRGHGTHRYYFVVLALDDKLGLPSGASVEEVLEKARGHVVAYGYVVGLYSR